MKLVCPSCGAVHSAEAWQNDPVARQCLKLAGEMPHAVASRCFAYLALFRPAREHPPSSPFKGGTPPLVPPRGGDSGGCQRSLQWKKVLRLLSELKELVTLPHVQWGKAVARPNSAHAWGTAMERMIEHPPKRLPLKSHGYLRSVAYEIADEMDKQREVKKNKAERTGQACHAKPEGRSVEGIAAEDMKMIRRKNFRKKIITKEQETIQEG
ncbi:MAG: hypothetical protein IMF10_09295 [Proteobacteria bacterium]|nr:hypothetical protein [Pseudomonadota bacterium]